ncbi:NAD(P)/FAD-dependent oxidoreductase [Helicobacter anatolicus]|uniref:NAD(P)/FAD-dependent oxidoreductase n=1 Tax=Helicobacter anatolicus TaxID=2905874 RepID=UPI001E421305|nr:NAD(P)/FAD-dependent oxidoreductase [Helicobacter anatolicus]MCE3039946.1 NAD(P)/FAD-dependent oxidoreductase [Helicobacter anatolicus]
MKKIVVLGAGYASLAFLKNLDLEALGDYEIFLISRYDYHYTSILLHEVVTGARRDARIYLTDILPHKIKIIQDEVLEIKEDKVLAKKQSYDYDYLVVGLGFQSDSFGIAGIKEYATPIVDFENALKLREKIYLQIEKYKKTKDCKDLKFVVCGGGFSGIETITSLAINLKKFCEEQGVDSTLLQFICIEAMPDILPMFSAKLVQKTKNFLKTENVELATGCKILRCEEGRVIVQRNDREEDIEAGLIIWTAGVKGNAVIENSSFFTSARSKVEVDTYLRPYNQENQDKMQNIYIIGDCAALKDVESGRFYPPTAQIAIKQGEYLAKAFKNRILGVGVEAFNYISEGTVCSLGEGCAIGNVKGRDISGKIAIFIKRMIEKKWLYKILGIRGIFR